MVKKSLLANQTSLTDYITDRLANTSGAAEGSTLLPRQRGAGRIPIVTGLKVTQINNFLGGSEFTLVWNDPQTSASLISAFNVYAKDQSSSDSPLLVGSVNSSPAKVRVVNSKATVLTFYCQTVLSSGAVSSLDHSPTCTAAVIAPVIQSSDIRVSADSIVPGGANQLIGTNPAGTAGEWKTLSGTANQITVTPGSGSINLSLASQLSLQALFLASITILSTSTIPSTVTTTFVDASGSNITVTTPATPHADQLLVVKRLDASANIVTIAANTGQVVETTSLVANKSIVFQYRSAAAKWQSIAAF